jgi:hypothetical protein
MQTRAWTIPGSMQVDGARVSSESTCHLHKSPHPLLMLAPRVLQHCRSAVTGALHVTICSSRLPACIACNSLDTVPFTPSDPARAGSEPCVCRQHAHAVQTRALRTYLWLFHRWSAYSRLCKWIRGDYSALWLMGFLFTASARRATPGRKMPC